MAGLWAKSVEAFGRRGAFMGAAFMSMTVADCLALCVLVALFVGAAAFWIGQGKFSEFWSNTKTPERAVPERAETTEC